MSVNVDTITGSIEADCPEGRFLCSEESQNAKQSLVIDSKQSTRLFTCCFIHSLQGLILLRTGYLVLSLAHLRISVYGRFAWAT